MIYDDNSCSIRELQHYLYCPHRWGLIYIDCSWVENYYVTKANLLHERVHDPDRAYTSKGKKILTSMVVFNDELGLYGVTDCVEASRELEFPPVKSRKVKGTPHDNDVKGRKTEVEDRDFTVTIVEYKPKKPKKAEYNPDDMMQVFAQKVCLEWMFPCRAEGILYYADVKKRVRLPLDENYSQYYEELQKLLSEIRERKETGRIPPIRKHQKCRGCSFIDMCLPDSEIKQAPPLFQQLEEMYQCENC